MPTKDEMIPAWECFQGRPSDEDLLLAAEWLDENEGEADESEPMKRTATWLRTFVAQLSAREQDEKIVRELAAETGASITRARIFWKHRKELLERRP